MKIDNPQKIKEAEIVIGIPSYNNAETIGFVVEQASFGLKKYFPDKKSAIINLDHNSSDGTKNVFFDAQVKVPRIYVSTPNGLKGKGYNFHNFFLMMDRLEAKVGIVLDSDLRSVRGDWIKKMALPVFKGYDFITPYYIRCKTDATITNHLIYPLTYGLLGWDIRQPIGGDFAFSDKMVKVWLKKEWVETTYQFGIDVFMTINALFGGMKIAQVNLGTKIHDLSTPKLGPMFFQVVGTFFSLITTHLKEIKKRKKIERVHIFNGKKFDLLANAKPDEIIFRKIFLENLDAYWPLIKKEVSSSVRKKLEKIYLDKQGNIDLDLWIKIVYDFLLAYKDSKDKPSLIHAFSCLYYGRVASFYRDSGNLTPEDVEKEVVKRAKYFFRKKNYFLDKV